MSTETGYTPTTEQVRDHWSAAGESEEGFDRWLNQQRADAAADALERGIAQVRKVYDMQCNPLCRDHYPADDYGYGAYTAHRWWVSVLGGTLDRLSETPASGDV